VAPIPVEAPVMRTAGLLDIERLLAWVDLFMMFIT
jgi:hypothetical protein